MLVERRRSAVSPALLIKVGFAWLAISLLVVMVNLGAIATLRFPDPDDILRVVQVRDLLAGQGWFDLTQHRMDAPGGGVPMHWSRLVDVPLVLMILALTPLIGAQSAEMIAIVAVPLITLGIAMLLAARIAWRLLGEREAVMACLAMALSAPLLFQMGPLRVDHHGWQIVCALAVMNGLMARRPRLGAWASGLSMAAWLAISIEGLPLAAAITGIAALRWMRNRADRVWLVHLMQALATGSILIFLGTRGWHDLATQCDAIGLAHIGMFCWGALVLSALSRAGPLPLGALLGGFSLAAGGAIGLFLLGAPQCSGGGFSQLDPVVADLWHAQVSEGQPIWRQTLPTVLEVVILPLLGIWASVRLATRNAEWLRRWWIDYAIVLVAALAVTLLVARAGAVAGALAAVPVGWQIRQWLNRVEHMKGGARRGLALSAIAVVLMPSLVFKLAPSEDPALANGPDMPVKASSCRIAETANRLRSLPVGEIYAPLDIGPRLLLETGHGVVATSHHRGQRGIREVIDIATGTPDEAGKRLRERGTRYVALCPDLNEPALYASISPDGFMARLLQDRAPEWLKPIDLGEDSSLKVWEVKSS